MLAKARAMYGRSLKDSDYRQLAECRTVPEIASYLKTRTSYGKALAGLPRLAEALQVLPGVVGFREAVEVSVRRQHLQVGLVIQNGRFSSAQAVAFFMTYIACIVTVGAVPGHFQIIRGKAVLRQKLCAPSRDLRGSLPEGEMTGVRTALLHRGSQKAFPQKIHGKGGSLLFQFLQFGDPRIGAHAALIEFVPVPVPDPCIFDHDLVILLFF